MKNFLKKMLVGSAALCLTFTAVACDGIVPTAEAESAYLTVDINPSLELVVSDGEITSVKACNEDAAVLLYGENLEGKTVEEAVKEIVALAEELGYLTASNDDVKITAIADDSELSLKIEKEAKKGAQKGSDKAKVNTDPRSEDERKVKELKEENPELFKKLNPAKLRLIEAIMKLDPNMTYEKGVGMKIHDLAELLDDLAEEFEDMIGDGLEGKFEQRFDELKKQKEEEIAKLYGEAYYAAWQKLESLETAYAELETSLESISVSETDLAAILDLLHIENAETIFADGVTLEEIENYVDRYLDKTFIGPEMERLEEIVENAVEKILEKYDVDEYILTADDLAKFEELFGETLQIESLEDLEEAIEDYEDTLEKLIEEVKLTEEQKAQIKGFNEEIKGLKDQIFDELKGEVEAYKAKIRDLKAQKRG